MPFSKKLTFAPLVLLLWFVLVACQQHSLPTKTETPTDYWQPRPLSALTATSGLTVDAAQPEQRLVGIALGRKVSLAELERNLKTLQLHTIYFQIVDISDRQRQDNASDPKVFLQQFKLEQEGAVSQSHKNDRKAVIANVARLRNDLRFKLVYGFMDNKTILGEVIRRHKPSRSFMQEMLQHARYRQAVPEVITGKREAVFALQVQGTIDEVRTFALVLNATGFVDSPADLLHSRRAKPPTEAPSSVEPTVAGVLELLTSLGLELDQLFAGNY